MLRVRLARGLALAAGALAILAPVSARAASVFVTNGSFFPGRVFSLAVAPNGTIALGSPPSYQITDNPEGVGFTPGGHQLYIAAGNNDGSNPGKLDQFSVSAAGGLTALSPATVTTGLYPGPVAVSPNGKSVYTATGGASPAVDQLTVQGGGTVTFKSPASVPADGYDDIVMTPDGRHLYVSTFGSLGLIDQFNVSASGTLSPMTPATVTTGAFPLGMAVAPDGHSLYAGLDSGGGLVAQFNIGANGALTAKNPATVGLSTSGDYPQSLAVSPNGKNLYVGDDFAGTGVAQFTIGAGGVLSAMSPRYVGTEDVTAVAVNPDGKSLYANTSANTTRYAIGAGGALTITTDVVATGPQPSGIAVSPDQGPIAAFAVKAAAAGHATAFNAGASHDPDGKVVSYAWSFGAGTSATTTAGPTLTHVYAHAGHFVATLRVTDNSGASTKQVFTGRQVLLNGGPAAQITRMVVIVAPPKLTGLHITPSQFKAARAGPGGATVSFHLSRAGRVLLTVQRRAAGRRLGHRCIPGRRHGASCSTYVRVPGSERISAARGANHVRFSGRWAGKALRSGRYRLVLTPYVGTVTGQLKVVKCRILH